MEAFWAFLQEETLEGGFETNYEQVAADQQRFYAPSHLMSILWQLHNLLVLHIGKPPLSVPPSIQCNKKHLPHSGRSLHSTSKLGDPIALPRQCDSWPDCNFRVWN